MSGERPLPCLRATATGAQLIVDGRPVLLLGGQLHNSSPSSPEYMEPIWDRLAGMGIRTVIGAASWAQVEPVEGSFDFSTVDAQIEAARAHGLRLVLIWFGAFKNAGSTYAPSWVRADTTRFPRAVRTAPHGAVHLSRRDAETCALGVLAGAARGRTPGLRRDAAAPCTVDPDHTVVMVQVENESGLVRDSRDRQRGRGSLGSPVPQALSTTSSSTGAGSGPNWPRSGRGRAAARPAPGRRSSATTGKPKRSSWPGASHPTRSPGGRRQGAEAAADVRQRMARPAGWAAARRRLPQWRPRPAGARRVEGSGTVP